MEDTINRIFDKLENADVSPSANYSMPEYYMHCAIRGREREKRLLFKWLSMSLGIDADLINKVFDERYGNVQNESRNMRRTIQLRESKLKHMISESVKKVLKEHGRDIDDDNYFGGGLPDRYFDDDDAPDDDRIYQTQIAQLDNIADIIAGIANNTSDDAELLFQAADKISEFTSRYK